MASTFNEHIIVCGLGHVGVRVVRELILLNEDIVVVEANADSPRFEQLREYDIPIIVGDGRSREVLKKAKLDKASAFIACTNDDLMNLQIAARVREMRPDIRLVMRMFDDQFARNMAESFKVDAVMSASGLAAPVFAGAATDTNIIHTFKVENETLVMGRLQVHAGTKLDGATVEAVEDSVDVSIVLLQSKGTVDTRPDPEIRLEAGDVIAVVSTSEQLRELNKNWNRTT